MKKVFVLVSAFLFIGCGVSNQAPQQPVVLEPPAAPDSPQDYIQLSVDDARALAESNGVLFRVVQEDGEYYAVTEDYRPGRINAVVEAGIVVDYNVE